MKRFAGILAGLILLGGCGRKDDAGPEQGSQGGSQAESQPSTAQATPEPSYATGDTTLEAFVKAGNKAVPASSPEAAAVPDPGSKASPEFDAALGAVLAEYHTMRRQLAADGVQGVPEAAGRLVTALEKLKAAPLPGATEKDNEAIRKSITDLEAAAKALTTGSDLRTTRKQFGPLTAPLLYLVAFHYHVPAVQQPYVYYCPMRELAWLQDVKAMGNPYYGSEMLTCGVVVPRANASRQRP